MIMGLVSLVRELRSAQRWLDELVASRPAGLSAGDLSESERALVGRISELEQAVDALLAGFGSGEKYLLEVTPTQLQLIEDCVEDCHRFAAGDFAMGNTVSLANRDSVYGIHPSTMHRVIGVAESVGLVPGLRAGQYLSYNATAWLGNTYQIWRGIKHYRTVESGVQNVYSSDTLPSGTEGKIVVHKL